MSTEFRFILSTRYPTEKAYGVTVGRTCQALRNLDVEASIFALNSTDRTIDDFGNQVTNILGNKVRFEFLYRRALAKPLNFVLWQLFLGLKIAFQQHHGKYTFCYRDIYLAIFPILFQRQSFHVIEIHHSLNSAKRELVKMMSRLGNVKVAYISPYLRERNEPQNQLKESTLIEMGVPSEFFMSQGKEKRDELSICFLGKGKSNGNANGIEDFASQIAKVKFKKELCLTFIGLNDQELELKIRDSLSLVPQFKFSFIDHISHEMVPKYLSSYKVGLIPYPDNRYHQDRFPIKILEYAALGLNILITDSKAHRSIIPEECAFFYDPTNSESLKKAINEIFNEKLSAKKRDNASDWVKSFTYENRAKKYLSFYEFEGPSK